MFLGNTQYDGRHVKLISIWRTLRPPRAIACHKLTKANSLIEANNKHNFRNQSIHPSFPMPHSFDVEQSFNLTASPQFFLTEPPKLPPSQHLILILLHYQAVSFNSVTSSVSIHKRRLLPVQPSNNRELSTSTSPDQLLAPNSSIVNKCSHFSLLISTQSSLI